MRECLIFISKKLVLKKNKETLMLSRKPAGCVGLAVLDSEIMACLPRSPSGDGKEARRRVWRVVGIGAGLLRHDGEAEGVVVKDDAVLELCVPGRARYTQAHIPK